MIQDLCGPFQSEQGRRHAGEQQTGQEIRDTSTLQKGERSNLGVVLRAFGTRIQCSLALKRTRSVLHKQKVSVKKNKLIHLHSSRQLIW